MWRIFLLPIVLSLGACHAVSAERIAAAPPELYWVEYYEISKG